MGRVYLYNTVRNQTEITPTWKLWMMWSYFLVRSTRVWRELENTIPFPGPSSFFKDIEGVFQVFQDCYPASLTAGIKIHFLSPLVQMTREHTVSLVQKCQTHIQFFNDLFLQTKVSLFWPESPSKLEFTPI